MAKKLSKAYFQRVALIKKMLNNFLWEILYPEKNRQKLMYSMKINIPSTDNLTTLCMGALKA